jgi:hypothetical protein
LKWVKTYDTRYRIRATRQETSLISGELLSSEIVMIVLLPARLADFILIQFSFDDFTAPTLRCNKLTCGQRAG